MSANLQHASTTTNNPFAIPSAGTRGTMAVLFLIYGNIHLSNMIGNEKSQKCVLHLNTEVEQLIILKDETEH